MRETQAIFDIPDGCERQGADALCYHCSHVDDELLPPAAVRIYFVGCEKK
jgi:hypothetical protein